MVGSISQGAGSSLYDMVRDPNGRAYNRTVHLAERKRMMARWATYLDELRLSVD